MGWFRCHFFAGRSECPDLTEEANAFFLLLSSDLKKLEHSLAEGSVSLRWSVEAMDLLKKMQIELVTLFKKSLLPISFASEEDWFEQFMQETSTLLDFCNSLKRALSGINRYRMVTDLMIQKIIENGSASVLNGLEFKMLEEEHEKLSSSTVRLRRETIVIGNGSECSNKSIAAIMIAAKATMIAISLILVPAVVSSEELVSEGYPELKVFAEMLASLVARFRVLKLDEGSRFLLAEHEMVDSVVGDLRAQVENGGEREGILESVGVLRTSSAELREGVELFDAVVDEVFDVVIRGRKEMLGIFRDGVLSM